MWIIGELHALGFDFCEIRRNFGSIQRFSVKNEWLIELLNRNIFFYNQTEFFVLEGVLVAVKVVNPNV